MMMKLIDFLLKTCRSICNRVSMSSGTIFIALYCSADLRDDDEPPR